MGVFNSTQVFAWESDSAHIAEFRLVL